MRYYVYVLQSESDGNFYTGYTNDLTERLKEHQSGKVFSTKARRPLKLIYYEFCLNQDDAKRREKYLKTAWGKRYIKTRLKDYLTGSPHEMENPQNDKLADKEIEITPLDRKLSNGVISRGNGHA